MLADVASCVREQLLNDNKVQLEGLGNVIFTPDSELENLIDDAVFKPMPSRVAQAAVLKAEKMVMLVWIWRRLRKREIVKSP